MINKRMKYVISGGIHGLQRKKKLSKAKAIFRNGKWRNLKTLKWKSQITNLMRTHYDVLNLDKNCSAKEIKDSFLKLSKIYHPDRNKKADAHSKFVEVNEAYSVLGKTESRLQYDESLYARRSVEYRTYGAQPHRTYNYNPHMYTQYRSHDAGSPNFIRSKLQWFCFCCVLIMFGTGIQIKASHDRRYIHSHRIAVALKERSDKKLKMSQEVIEQLRKVSK